MPEVPALKVIDVHMDDRRLDGDLDRRLMLGRSLGRLPRAEEAKLAAEFLHRREAYYQQHPPPPEAPAKPLVRSITSELTGTAVEVEEDQIPVPYEDDLKPSQTSPATRALADLALSLFNTNEFAYVY